MTVSNTYNGTNSIGGPSTSQSFSITGTNVNDIICIMTSMNGMNVGGLLNITSVPSGVNPLEEMYSYYQPGFQVYDPIGYIYNVATAGTQTFTLTTSSANPYPNIMQYQVWAFRSTSASFTPLSEGTQSGTGNNRGGYYGGAAPLYNGIDQVWIGIAQTTAGTGQFNSTASSNFNTGGMTAYKTPASLSGWSAPFWLSGTAYQDYAESSVVIYWGNPPNSIVMII